MTHFKTQFTRAAAALFVAGTMSVATPALAEPFIGEVRAFGENFCPRGWTQANGELLAISNNPALFSVIGTIYGGDGRTTMAVPNLIGRAPQSPGNGPGLNSVAYGQQGGAPTRTLTQANMPSHNHIVNATNAQGNKLGPGGDFLADPNTNDPNTEVQIYKSGTDTPNQTMDPGMIGSSGGSQPLSVQSPYLALNWCMATIGLYPSRN